MTPTDLLRLSIEPALTLLPDHMDSAEARIMVVTIALQESRIVHRRQVRGPAKGFWRFEEGDGVRGVLHHHASREHAERVCSTLRYRPKEPIIHTAIEHNDVLAAAFARLLLWTLPAALPRTAEEGWEQYLDAWRPGKPHRDTWDPFYDQAAEAIFLQTIASIPMPETPMYSSVDDLLEDLDDDHATSSNPRQAKRFLRPDER